jgi:hypothetical protein
VEAPDDRFDGADRSDGDILSVLTDDRRFQYASSLWLDDIGFVRVPTEVLGYYGKSFGTTQSLTAENHQTLILCAVIPILSAQLMRRSMGITVSRKMCLGVEINGIQCYIVVVIIKQCVGVVFLCVGFVGWLSSA